MQSLMERRALAVIGELRKHGHAAYMVGGCVRDRCLGREVKDIDIATSASPEEVLRLFPRTVPTGIRHGTVTVIVDGTPFEVTTFREEAEYKDYRRPEAVRFIDDLEADLRRRDFTMNAMALDWNGELIDPFGGRKDLEDGVIRCVGSADERFTEDALRMMRCIRFAAEYGLTIVPETYEAILRHAPLLQHVAMERIRMELEHIVGGADPLRGIRLLVDTGLYRWFKDGMGWPAERWEAAARFAPLEVIGRLDEPSLRWCLWLIALGCDAEEARGFLKKLTCSNATIRRIAAVIAWHRCVPELTTARAWKAAALRAGKATAGDWLKIAGTTAAAQPAAAIAPAVPLAEAGRWLEEMPIAGIGDLAVSGDDVKRLPGISGRRIGEMLERLALAVATGDLPNRRDALMEQAAAWTEASGT
jgi:tRNA nucleotidyltransferase (CCA-adding enzyme)